MAVIFIALGSNLGDRLSYIEKAVVLLKASGVVIQRLSKVIETNPVGGPAQGKYLNAVLKAKTDLTPEELHALTQSIEAKMGRVRKILNGPRVIDIDILLYDDVKLITRKLIIPHPRMCGRDFVMNPLKEIDSKVYQELLDASR